MAAARHNSVAASLPYQGRGVESECNRLNALIGKKNKKRTYIQRLMEEDSSDEDVSTITENETFKSEPSVLTIQEEEKPAVKPAIFELEQEEENKNDYSVFTQYQYNNLNNELNQMEKALHTSEQRHQISSREMEMMLMRKRLRNLQQQAYVREMQSRELERMRLFQTYPYSSLNTDDDLYFDSLRYFKQEERESSRRRSNLKGSCLDP